MHCWIEQNASHQRYALVVVECLFICFVFSHLIAIVERGWERMKIVHNYVIILMLFQTCMTFQKKIFDKISFCRLYSERIDQCCLKGSYDAILKIIILCIWCNRICWHALMFRKHIIFQILYIIVVPLCPASLKRFVFYKAPPSDEHRLLWLANWPSALWLAQHHKCKSEM